MSTGQSPTAPVPPSLRATVLRFALIYGVLTLLYTWGRGSVDTFVIEVITVRPAAFFLNLIDSSLAVRPEGPRLLAAGGGLNVLQGCEGTEALLLLLAALVVAPLSWRQRALGAVVGALVVFVANQARLVALFFAVRNAPDWFAPLHGFVLPLAMVGAVVVWFAWLLRRFAPPATGAVRGAVA